MYHIPPKDWIEICEDAMESALKTLDHRQDGFGYYYERHNEKRFAIKFDGKWLGSPEYFIHAEQVRQLHSPQ